MRMMRVGVRCNVRERRARRVAVLRAGVSPFPSQHQPLLAIVRKCQKESGCMAEALIIFENSGGGKAGSNAQSFPVMKVREFIAQSATRGINFGQIAFSAPRSLRSARL